jgi:lipoyl(octanoyl) transferase
MSDLHPRPAVLIEPVQPVPYDDASAAMHGLAERRLADEIPDAVVLLEHPPVLTAGRRARDGELRWSRTEASARGVQVRQVDRGGAFTFHGPGQLVGYPIVDLGPGPDAGAYLRDLEEVVIRAAAEVDVDLHRRPDMQTGVWSGDQKICAIGVRLLRGRVSLHGFALNCTTDLAWFDAIVPCGLPGAEVGSLSSLAGRSITVADIRPHIVRHLAGVLGLRFRAATPGAFWPIERTRRAAG